MPLPRSQVEAFAALYGEHIPREESLVFAFARESLQDLEREAPGRRGSTPRREASVAEVLGNHG